MNILLSFLIFLGAFSDLSKINFQKENKTQVFESQEIKDTPQDTILTLGAERFEEYLPLLEGKRVALVVNQTSVIGNTHLVDTLLSLEINVKKVFAPEHGFRGDADAGTAVQNSKDVKTGLSIISLYGSTKKPSPTHLQDIDVIIFDIQDVGVRFYTYISTMHYVMEACAENQKKCIILDRPNPNGDYVAGPVLDMSYKSFVGMHPIPIVHGLTVGELAKMIVGEKWLGNWQLDLEVISMKGYTHKTPYSLPIKPSPNLPNDLSIRLYPSLCLFEGTAISVGRGTYFPFQVIGYPNANMGDFQFTPQSIQGMSSNPKHLGKVCYGIDFRKRTSIPEFTLKYLIDYYQKFPNKANFFNGYFDTLAGNSTLQSQIKSGLDAQSIINSWEANLEKYKSMRKKYLMYP